MNHKSIYAHCLVKNEERWLWYAVSSVINHVDKLLLWDTGSTDRTPEIERELIKKYPDKIIFRKRPQDTAEEFTKVRQEMLNETSSDWFIVLDADEIWWEDSIKKVVDLIHKKGDAYESIIVPNILPVGDLYHYREKAAGKYRIAGRKGHYNLRAVRRNIPGLQVSGPHGKMGYIDSSGHMIQDRDTSKIGFIEAPYLHTTHLLRAGSGKDSDVIKRKMKFKYEIGKPFPKDYYYPEVFFRNRPEYIENPWKVMDKNYRIRAFIETPLRKLKRSVWNRGEGY